MDVYEGSACKSMHHSLSVQAGAGRCSYAAARKYDGDSKEGLSEPLVVANLTGDRQPCKLSQSTSGDRDETSLTERNE